MFVHATRKGMMGEGRGMKVGCGRGEGERRGVMGDGGVRGRE